MLELLKNKKILVVVAHPDDELLGLGGTLHRLQREFKSEISVLILGEGLTSRDTVRDLSTFAGELKIHRQNAEAARKLIGYSHLEFADFPDNRFDSVDLLDLVKVIEKSKKNFGAQVVFTHHVGDLNIDHQRTAQAVMTACRPLAGESVKTVLSFETPSSTEWQSVNIDCQFRPNYFVELSVADLEAKVAGMECYQYEKRSFPHPRSPEALKIRAQAWGVQIGVAYAEPFTLLRQISEISS